MTAARAPASALFVSPGTTTSFEPLSASSSLIIIVPVWYACEPLPTPRCFSGFGSPSSSKNTWSISKS